MQKAAIASTCSQITVMQMELQLAEQREVEKEKSTVSAGQVSTPYDPVFLFLTTVEICIKSSAV